MQLSTVFLALSTAIVVDAANVKFYKERNCNGGVVHEYRIGCNVCADPPGDYFGVLATEINGDQRVTSHNQDRCTPASQVGQWFGPVCNAAGNTAIRSFWIACAGQFAPDAETRHVKLSELDAIESTEETVPEGIVTFTNA